MQHTRPNEITLVLEEVQRGDLAAQSRLLSLVYRELHQLAQSHMCRERADHTLQPTALVNEVFLRLLGGVTPHWQNRAHFFGAAAEAMRRILVDHARARLAMKRGGHLHRAEGLTSEEVIDAGAEEVIEIDAALAALDEFDARKSRIVQLRFFAGLGVEEVADIMQLSTRTVKREWRFAKAWLYRRLHSFEPPNGDRTRKSKSLDNAPDNQRA